MLECLQKSGRDNPDRLMFSTLEEDQLCSCLTKNKTQCDMTIGQGEWGKLLLNTPMHYILAKYPKNGIINISQKYKETSAFLLPFISFFIEAEEIFSSWNSRSLMSIWISLLGRSQVIMTTETCTLPFLGFCESDQCWFWIELSNSLCGSDGKIFSW